MQTYARDDAALTDIIYVSIGGANNRKNRIRFATISCVCKNNICFQLRRSLDGVECLFETPAFKRINCRCLKFFEDIVFSIHRKFSIDRKELV